MKKISRMAVIAVIIAEFAILAMYLNDPYRKARVRERYLLECGVEPLMAFKTALCEAGITNPSSYDDIAEDYD